jgi:hypothetical protein
LIIDLTDFLAILRLFFKQVKKTGRADAAKQAQFKVSECEL